MLTVGPLLPKEDSSATRVQFWQKSTVRGDRSHVIRLVDGLRMPLTKGMTAPGSTGMLSSSWPAVAGAEFFRFYRGTLPAVG